MKTFTIREYYSNAVLTTIPAKNSALNAWCAKHGYLPHHKVNYVWIVIK